MSEEQHFLAAYPTVVYRTTDGTQQSFSPPIPVKPHGQPILHIDVPRPGAYPDYVVLDLLRERNMYKNMYEDMRADAEEAWNQQGMYRALYEDQLRLANVLRQKLNALEAGLGYQADSSSGAGQ